MSDRLGNQRHTQKEIRATEKRCIYCSTVGPLTVEHMPPLVMFKGRQRPRGLEFGVCQPCNNGTRGADLAATFVSKLDIIADQGSWQLEENMRQHAILKKRAPGFLEELFSMPNMRSVLWRTPGGIMLPRWQIQANGPHVRAHLNVFVAKFAMCLFREHIGTPLPLDGLVRTAWFLNAGLTQPQVHAAISILPGVGGLRQGSKTSDGQFTYVYNTDTRSIVMAFASFHKGLHALVLASSDPQFFEIEFPHATTNVMRPGQLLTALGSP